MNLQFAVRILIPLFLIINANVVQNVNASSVEVINQEEKEEERILSLVEKQESDGALPSIQASLRDDTHETETGSDLNFKAGK